MEQINSPVDYKNDRFPSLYIFLVSGRLQRESCFDIRFILPPPAGGGSRGRRLFVRSRLHSRPYQIRVLVNLGGEQVELFGVIFEVQEARMFGQLEIMIDEDVGLARFVEAHELKNGFVEPQVVVIGVDAEVRKGVEQLVVDEVVFDEGEEEFFTGLLSFDFYLFHDTKVGAIPIGNKRRNEHLTLIVRVVLKAKLYFCNLELQLFKLCFEVEC